MSRPKTITDQQILEIARTLFLERGPSIPTAEIARVVGISEGLIFKRFPTKHALFLAAMGVKSSSWAEMLEDLEGKGDLRQNLQRIIAQLLGFVRDLLPATMLLWSCRGDAPEQHLRNLRDKDSPPKKGLEALVSYFRKEMKARRVHAADPEVLARIVLGSVWNMVFMETIGQAPRVEPMEFAQRLVNTLWDGIAPRAEVA